MTPSPQVVELLPCPFCGTKVSYTYCGTGSYEFYAIEGGCIFCKDGMLVTQGGIISTDSNIVIKAWNARTPKDGKTLVELDEDKLINVIVMAEATNPKIKLNKDITWIQDAPKLAKYICSKFGTHREGVEPQYPCDNCGKLRTKAEGGTTFSICDDCWDKKYPKTPCSHDDLSLSQKSKYYRTLLEKQNEGT